MRPFPTHRSAPTRPLPRPLPVCPTSPSAPEDVENVLHGMRVLRDFEKEARALSDLRSELSTSARKLFECSICMDKMPADSFARIDTCGHTFCRECLRGHVIARLEEHRFPVLCPTCTADKGKGKKKAGGTCRSRMVVTVILTRPRDFPSEILESLALNLGLTDEQFRIWTEMEMASFSIPIHCRKYVCGAHPLNSCVNDGTGASSRCSWPETTTKRPTPSFVRFRTANTHGVNNVNNQSILVGRNTHAMVPRN